MAGGGTGAPAYFRCSRCRRARVRWPSGCHTRVELTGKSRKNNSSTKWPRVAYAHYQYRCLDCGHIGWSNHVQLADKAGRDRGWSP